MRKFLTAAAFTGLLALSMSVPALAGAWQYNARGWWYDNGDGTWPANTWQWIDGDNDGVCRCFYFDGDGYLLQGTLTPDGNYVNADGEWVPYYYSESDRNRTPAGKLNPQNYTAVNGTYSYRRSYDFLTPSISLPDDGYEEPDVTITALDPDTIRIFMLNRYTAQLKWDGSGYSSDDFGYRFFLDDDGPHTVAYTEDWCMRSFVKEN